MLYSTIGRYSVGLATLPEQVDAGIRMSTVVTEKIDCDGNNSDYLALTVREEGAGSLLLVEGYYSPGPSSGFYPGVLVVPETRVAFVGAGTSILCFSLAPITRLARERVEVGFWKWQRHGEWVLMSAELEFSVWSSHGKKLWSRFVEPPWDFVVQGDEVVLDVMGDRQTFCLLSGEPRSPAL
ncbi:hypothetical protein L682_00905 [Aquipseudomonas alcaligenes OT 69]|nr:hypothetical protein L682_00905 [Pseudomonas alcaligenes OT 69]